MRKLASRACLCVWLPFLGQPALMAHDEEAVDLKVGDAAPEFVVHDDEGNIWDSRKHVGKKFVVVYFYPAAMTGGCTKQACAYRDNQQVLADNDIEVVGVSGDSVRSLQLFRKAEKLNFSLLADIRGEVARRFGVEVRDGGTLTREVAGVEEVLERGVSARRWTFVIDKDGKIAYKNTRVNAEQDCAQVLEVVRELKTEA